MSTAINALQRHRRSVWLAVVLLTLAGLGGAFGLPVTLFPHIDYPRVVVSINAGERDAEQMAAEITRPVEIALRATPGVTGIRSTTSRGTAEVAVSFAWGGDMVASTLGVQAALATVAQALPPGVTTTVRRSDPTIFPVLGLALTSTTTSAAGLRQLAELQLRPLLTTVPGVAGIDVLGASAPEIAVETDPARLAALGLTLDNVVTALKNSNTVAGVGRIESRHRLYLALVENRVATPAAIAAIPVKTGKTAGAGLVTLGQVATVSRSVAPAYTRVTADGRDAVLVNIRQTPTADAVALVAAVDARMKAAGLPRDVHIAPFYDQSELVRDAAISVRDAILIGAALAGVVLFIFLRSPRLMLITAVMLPAVLAAACLALYALGLSFNMMTLGGMAAAVGLVVDDAVVMFEHLMRRMQERAKLTTLAAAAEMAKPLFGSTAATVVVFLPLAFISGVTGGFFKSLAITIAASLIVSLLYARYVIPLVAAGWLTAKDAEAADKAEKMMGGMTRRYARAIDRAFDRPALFTGIIAAVLIVAGGVAYTQVQSGFMPKMDEGGFILDYKAKPGSALGDTDALLRRAEAIIRATPEVVSYSRRTGVQLGGGLTEADEGDFFIRLTSGSRRNIEEVMSEVRGKIAAQVPGLDVETAQLMEDLIGDLTAVPQPVEVKLFGENPTALIEGAVTVSEAIGKITGVVEVRDGLRVAGDAVVIQVDPAQAALAGLDPAAVATQLSAIVGGAVGTRIRQGTQLIDVRVRAPLDARARAASLGGLPLRAADGRSVRLDQIAKIEISAGQRQITREDLAPFVGVTARLEGRDLGSAMSEVRKTVAALHLPPGVRVDYGGLYAQQQQSFRDLSTVFAAALLLAALLLTLLFERWDFTLAVIATVLLSAMAVLAGLWLTGTELDISALMGLTMVVGMITELAVFLLAELDPAAPVDRAALQHAGEARLRPILMSALIAILTLLPLALGIGRGSGLQKPLATAIIAGLGVGAPLVLTLLPGLLLLGKSRKAIETKG
jgi:multidrug efflux pump subunit AcrB